ncbi:MAG: RNA-binding protein [Thaumarchaeota archaeon]|nr:RNA-binding protein [Nitrososphaerota archaeon]
MQLDEVHDSLAQAEKRLQGTVGRRERLLKESRDIISSCSKAIVHLHTRKFQDSRKELGNARRLLRDLRKDHDAALSRYLISPEAEFVEASTVTAVVRGEDLPSMASLGVGPEGYLLGLLDSIGEMKRLVLDSIMDGKMVKARQYFSLMERLYGVLSPFAAFDNIVNGTRRKIDLARILIEDIRGVLAEEARREKLTSSMQRLQKKIEASRKR